VLLLILPSEKATAGRQTQDTALEIGKRYQLPVPQNSLSSTESEKTQASDNNVAVKTEDENKKNEIDEVTEDESELFESYTWDTAKVKSGDSLAKILKRLGYSPRTTHELSIAKGKDSKLLQKLNIGDQLHIAKDENGKLVALTYPLSKTDTLYVNWNTDHYESHVETKTVEIRETTAHGIIKSNFWSAGIEAGLDDAQIINLANIFGWDIDFALDIRSGDSFHVVYENKYIDGEFIGAGKILAIC